MSGDTSDKLALLMLRWDRPMVQLTIDNDISVFELIEQRYIENVLVYFAYLIVDPWGDPKRGDIYLVQPGPEPTAIMLITIPTAQIPGKVRLGRYSRLAVVNPEKFRGDIFSYVDDLQAQLNLKQAADRALRNLDAAGLLDWRQLRRLLNDFIMYSPEIPVPIRTRQLLEYENPLPTLKRRCTDALVDICDAMHQASIANRQKD